MFRELAKMICSVMILSTTLAWSGPRGTVVELDNLGPDSKGSIDYDTGCIEVTKTATVDMSIMKNSIQAEGVARSTAATLGRKMIAEVIGTVQIDSKTLIEHELATKDFLKAEIFQAVKGARVIEDKVEWVYDRKSKEEIPMATVRMQMCMRGENGLAAAMNKAFVLTSVFEIPPAAEPPPPPAPAPSTQQITTQPAISTVVTTTTTTTMVVPSQEQPATKTVEKPKGVEGVVEKPKPTPQPDQVRTRYGYVIIDSSKVNPGYRPALHVYIKDENGKVVYGPGVARSSITREGGRIIRYAKTIDEAKQIFASSGEPILLNALKMGQPGEVILSAKDSLALDESNKTTQFLKDAKVVLVMD